MELQGYESDTGVIKVGDTVNAKPLRKRAFRAVVQRIIADDTGLEIKEVEVVGGPGAHRSIRTFVPERITTV